jgi:hypothetical protein
VFYAVAMSIGGVDLMEAENITMTSVFDRV